MGPRKKIYISIIVFVIVNVLLITLFLIPVLAKIQNNSKELIAQKEELARLKKEIETFQETKSIYENSRENIAKIGKLFYNPDEPMIFFDFLTEKPKSYGLGNEILKMIPDSKTQTSAWKSYFFQISSLGSFPSLMKFIKSLESGPYLIEILNTSIKKTSGEVIGAAVSQNPTLGNVSASLSIKVYSK